MAYKLLSERMKKGGRGRKRNGRKRRRKKSKEKTRNDGAMDMCSYKNTEACNSDRNEEKFPRGCALMWSLGAAYTQLNKLQVCILLILSFCVVTALREVVKRTRDFFSL